jgi:hypothetical protein
MKTNYIEIQPFIMQILPLMNSRPKNIFFGNMPVTQCATIAIPAIHRQKATVM